MIRGESKYRSLSSLLLVPLVAISLAASCGCHRATVGSLPSPNDGELFSRATKRVYLLKEGNTDTDILMGWVTYEITERSDGEEDSITFVKDDHLKVLGFYINDSGATYTYDDQLNPVHQGNLAWQAALEVLYGEDGVYRVADEI